MIVPCVHLKRKIVKQRVRDETAAALNTAATGTFSLVKRYQRFLIMS